MSGWNTLAQAEPLAITLGRENLVVVDCRHQLDDTEAGSRQYVHSHIPGAVFAHMDRDLSEHVQDGDGGRHPWPNADAFIDRLERWGITPGHQVIAYDGGDGAFAARLWFLLRCLGHEKVAVLDGGWKWWTSLGLPVTTTVPHRQMEHYPRRDFDRSRLLDADGVQALLAAGGCLIDARAPERFSGEVEPIDRLGGHVPGARNLPYSHNLKDGRFLPASELARQFREVLDGISPQRTAVMCGSGVTACHHLLAMERAGMPGAALYTGSWSGWIADPERPVATGPE